MAKTLSFRKEISLTCFSRGKWDYGKIYEIKPEGRDLICSKNGFSVKVAGKTEYSNRCIKPTESWVDMKNGIVVLAEGVITTLPENIDVF